MASKLVRFSADDVTYYSLPSNSSEMSFDGEVVDDSVLGQTYESGFTSLLNWNINADGIYKGEAGYNTCVLKEGTPVATTGEAMSLVSGKTYKITDTSKDIFSDTATITVYDDAVDVTAQVETYNYLFGTITFASGYSVVGAITIDVTYIPVAVVGRFNTFTLTQSVSAVDDSDFQSLKANNGYRLNTQGLRSVNLEASGIFDATEDFHQQLEDRDYFVLEVQADENAYSKARGYFRISTASQSGAVGDNEQESVTFVLNVPSSDYVPFGWEHDASSTLNSSILLALDAFEDETNLYVEYLPNGVGGAGGKTGQGVVTDISLSSSVDDMPRFSIAIQGDGALVDA